VDAVPNDGTRFVNNVPVALTGLGGGFSAATAINNSGKTVGYSENAAGEIKAVRWTVSVTGGVVSKPITTLAPPAGNTYSAAYGINTAGVTVGESEDVTTIRAAMWPAADGAAATFLSLTGAAAPAAAYGINNIGTGQIAGEAMIGGALHAVCWNTATAAPIDLGLLPGGTFSSAYGINDGGVIVGEADVAGGAITAVAWRVSAAGVKTAGPVNLGVITNGDVASVAFDVDNKGRVVGESQTAAGVVHAAMWTLAETLVPSARTDLGANGTAYAITDGTRIAGNLGTAEAATLWDTQNTKISDGAGPATTTVSQALGINAGNMVVGLHGTQAFVAVPK
jgi:probable HAF family extracellular repeat protein